MGRILSRTMGVLLVIAGRASADNIEVTTEADAGAGSLREAITLANGTFGGDRITFAPGVERIQPLSALPMLYDATGGTAIVSDRSVILDGSMAPGGCFDIRSNGNRIEGLVIVSFPGEAIFVFQADNNVITGCWLGTDGVSASVGNSVGVILSDADFTVIGGPGEGARNVISGNINTAISMGSDNLQGCIIQGNYIGTDVTGQFALGNGGDGIFCGDGANNLIGGPNPGEGNVIVGSGRYGIFVGNGNATGNRVEGNIVGLNAAGTVAIPNTDWAVFVSRADNSIGGATPGAGNVISGNSTHGIVCLLTSNIDIVGNIVGLGLDGVTPFGNGGHGILLDGASNVVVGGTTPAHANTVSANALAGIYLEDEADDVVIRGNRIGTTVDGVSQAGTQLKGVFITNCEDVAVGGATAAAGNVIAYHTEQGVHAIAPNVNRLNIRSNSIHSNGMQGILLASGVNPTAAVPAISSVAPLQGTAPALSIVEVFADNDTEGRILVDTVQATAGGTFSSSVELAPYGSLNVTATATVGDGSTSAFSAAVSIDLPLPPHAGDSDGNGELSLTEMLRLVQFYNAQHFGCDGGSEDGYAPGAADQTCTPHDLDYNSQDWAFVLSELLRGIQFFNAGGYVSCPDMLPATEDGFCPGAAS